MGVSPDAHTGKLMTILGSTDHAPRTGSVDLQTRLVDYAGLVDELRSPQEVLNELHAVTTRNLPLPVLGAACLPIKSGDWEAVQLGKSAFLHDDVPEGWWEEYEALARGKFRPGLFFAGFSMASHTWTEVRRLMQPIGIDKWSYELALKYSMRDGLMCPVGGRWLVGFWSLPDRSPWRRTLLQAADADAHPPTGRGAIDVSSLRSAAPGRCRFAWPATLGAQARSR